VVQKPRLNRMDLLMEAPQRMWRLRLAPENRGAM
jgi:hypothetical protein